MRLLLFFLAVLPALEAFIVGDLLEALGLSAAKATSPAPDAAAGPDGQPAVVLSVVNNGDGADPADIATSFLNDEMGSGQPNYEGAENPMNEGLQDGIVVIASGEQGKPENEMPEVDTPPPSEAPAEPLQKEKQPDQPKTEDANQTKPAESATEQSTPAAQPAAPQPNAEVTTEAPKPTTEPNPKCSDKYPKVICENYRFYGYCDTLKSRLAFYCERSCGMCSDECVNDDKRCTQTEFHCKPEITNIPNSSCQALCGGCEVKLTAEQHDQLKQYTKQSTESESSEQKLQHNLWPYTSESGKKEEAKA